MRPFNQKEGQKQFGVEMISPHKTRGKYFVVVAFFFQMLTNALPLRTSVMPMLTVLILMVHTTVRVIQDILEMDTTAQVRPIM